MQHWRKNRAPTRYSANLLVGGASHRITVVNVHEDGAGIEGGPPLAVGAAVTLQVMHHRVASKIAWARGGAAGLRFQTPIAAQLLSTLRRLVRR
ncbi:PilZ domain-containing protein [uncultured Roseobacter sp.]|uniref:PilZ domain-containing protein n=1 Tax=uncultured Roseobacter sp. TaxID=114847 RepID=UPI002619AA6B|nr:PilZ domain-containing protein [uncultured Roseobacter sp.]